MAARYWCHGCSNTVIPVLEDEIKCPLCHSGFMEELTSGSPIETNRALALWAPFLHLMMRNSAPVLQGNRGGTGSRSENVEEDMNILNETQNETIFGSFYDYFTDHGFDLFLQQMAENDSIRYGTPPTKKEAIEALKTVEIEEKLQCSVCLDDFEMGMEVKELPCKHKYHCGCILPWLELHSSCPICRYQLPFEESFRAHVHGRSQ